MTTALSIMSTNALRVRLALYTSIAVLGSLLSEPTRLRQAHDWVDWFIIVGGAGMQGLIVARAFIDKSTDDPTGALKKVLTLAVLFFSISFLTSCAIDQNGDPYIQTPRISTKVAFLGDSVLWGYGVIGISHPDLHVNVPSYDGKAIVP